MESFRQLKILTIVSLIQDVILQAVNSGQQRHNDIHNYNTRNASNFSLPTHHLSPLEKKPSYKGALYFNKLPDNIKQQQPKHFKKALNEWLQERPFYNEDEFLNSDLFIKKEDLMKLTEVFKRRSKGQGMVNEEKSQHISRRSEENPAKLDS
ncbi:hypothetical protein J6590_014417 [Homalodisca vitripennis]|nr:hypothetical protein J6590_014417 [Homalodisca vitripennis]